MRRQGGGAAVLVKRTAKYELSTKEGTTVLGVETPKSLFPRGLLHTSMVAHIAVQKFGLGVPLYRLEEHFAKSAIALDRGTMCHYLEQAGGTLGATVVHAMMRDAIENCCVLSTDATSALVQPEKSKNGLDQACNKGYFFTIVADCDHVLFSYTEKHDLDAVKKLFSGFTGYLQADASNVYDILDRGPPQDTEEQPNSGVKLVGCWGHCRRYFFDAAICKYAVAVRSLILIRAIFAADSALHGLPPSKRKELRNAHVRPLIDQFFEWVRAAKATMTGRNLATSALGCAINQELELRRVLDDPRLPLDNTRSERSLRKIVVGRKNWLFYGSNVHAESAAALFSIVASCRLHRLDPELYFDEIYRLLAKGSLPGTRSEILGKNPGTPQPKGTRRPNWALHHSSALTPRQAKPSLCQFADGLRAALTF
ncbi:MAG: IS66 family transposase [Polyangiaceae bacterium]|nr:IS66 family transposase [Polyangiaceae bacterium]